MNKFLLKLYITGHTPNGERAIANLRRICEEELGGQYEMRIIDVLENPQLAEDERIIGDLSNTEKVLLGLDVMPVIEEGEKS